MACSCDAWRSTKSKIRTYNPVGIQKVRKKDAVRLIKAPKYSKRINASDSTVNVRRQSCLQSLDDKCRVYPLHQISTKKSEVPDLFCGYPGQSFLDSDNNASHHVESDYNVQQLNHRVSSVYDHAQHVLRRVEELLRSPSSSRAESGTAPDADTGYLRRVFPSNTKTNPNSDIHRYDSLSQLKAYNYAAVSSIRLPSPVFSMDSTHDSICTEDLEDRVLSLQREINKERQRGDKLQEIQKQTRLCGEQDIGSKTSEQLWVNREFFRNDDLLVIEDKVNLLKTTLTIDAAADTTTTTTTANAIGKILSSVASTPSSRSIKIATHSNSDVASAIPSIDRIPMLGNLSRISQSSQTDLFPPSSECKFFQHSSCQANNNRDTLGVDTFHKSSTHSSGSSSRQHTRKVATSCGSESACSFSNKADEGSWCSSNGGSNILKEESYRESRQAVNESSTQINADSCKATEATSFDGNNLKSTFCCTDEEKLKGSLLQVAPVAESLGHIPPSLVSTTRSLISNQSFVSFPGTTSLVAANIDSTVSSCGSSAVTAATAIARKFLSLSSLHPPISSSPVPSPASLTKQLWKQSKDDFEQTPCSGGAVNNSRPDILSSATVFISNKSQPNIPPTPDNSNFSPDSELHPLSTTVSAIVPTTKINTPSTDISSRLVPEGQNSELPMNRRLPQNPFQPLYRPVTPFSEHSVTGDAAFEANSSTASCNKKLAQSNKASSPVVSSRSTCSSAENASSTCPCCSRCSSLSTQRPLTSFLFTSIATTEENQQKICTHQQCPQGTAVKISTGESFPVNHALISNDMHATNLISGDLQADPSPRVQYSRNSESSSSSSSSSSTQSSSSSSTSRSFSSDR